MRKEKNVCNECIRRVQETEPYSFVVVTDRLSNIHSVGRCDICHNPHTLLEGFFLVHQSPKLLEAA